MDKIENAIECILFANGDPVSIYRLAEVLDIEKKQLANILTNFIIEYNSKDSGLKIIKMEESYQLCTREEYADYVKKALDHRRNSPLSQAALEVLAIIAYNQPVTKAYIEQIRGVDCSGVMNTLLEKDLICECGRLDAPGKPLLYDVTDNFLRVFNLSSLSELPSISNETKEEAVQLTTDEMS